MKLRLNISKKVFLLFATLTSLTVVLALTVYAGLYGLMQAGGEVRLVQDFQLQIRELSSFQIGNREEKAFPDRARFAREFSKATGLLGRMEEQESSLNPDVRKRIGSIRSYLVYYGTAFDELFDKYEQDVVLHEKQKRLSRDFYRMLDRLPAEDGAVLFRKIHDMPGSFEEVYHHRGLAMIPAMKALRNSIVAIPAAGELLPAIDELVANTEALYLNFLAIRDREDFLTDTAAHFFDFSTKSISAISVDNRRKQAFLSRIIVLVSVFAILLTMLFWWRVTRYFRSFVARQQEAIRSIEKAKYDYDPGPGIPDDEIGDLSRFMKELAANLKRNMDQLRKSEKELLVAKEEWERTFDAIGDIVTVQDADMRIIRANRVTFEIFGNRPDEVIGKKCHQLFRGCGEPCEGCPILDSLEYFEPYTAEIVHQSLGKTFLVSASPMLDEKGALQRIIHFAKDITEHKKLEMQFLQAQKMEAIGRLSGGVAHDFNNILSSILGYSELALLRKDDEQGWREDVEVIRQAGEKAAALIRQLLAFSSRKQLDIRNVNISESVQSLYKMLLRVIGEDVTLDLQLAGEVSIINADPGQIEQAVMNLAVNARDAMPMGGRLVITTANIMVDRHYARTHVGMIPGPFVMLAVSDNGHGMSREVKERIFEPFFTTKQAGKGTGLGLATVYNIVKQHKGFIDVYSEPEKGTTFKLYFPATGKTVVQLKQQLQQSERPRYGRETILVVDDEAIIRQIVVDSLSPLGYTLLGAAGGDEALRVAEQFPDKIDLLLTDMIMPGMDGLTLATKLHEKSPETKLLFMSGYLDLNIEKNSLFDSGKNFLSKPIMPSTLMRKLREMLGDDASL